MFSFKSNPVRFSHLYYFQYELWEQTVSILTAQLQFNFFSIAPKQQTKSCFYSKVKTATVIQTPKNSINHMSKHFGKRGKGKLPFYRKKPPAEPGTGSAAICCVGVSEGSWTESWQIAYNNIRINSLDFINRP